MDDPIDMVLHCPMCGKQHIDAPEPEKEWANPPHKSHLCHKCGCVWRPANVPTNGVRMIATRGEKDTWPCVIKPAVADPSKMCCGLRSDCTGPPCCATRGGVSDERRDEATPVPAVGL